MSQGTSCWSPSEHSGVPVGYAATDEHSVSVWAQDTTAVPSGQPVSPLDILFFTGPDGFPCMIEEQADMGPDPNYLLSQEFENIKPAGITDHFSFDGNANAQLDYHGQGALSLDISPTYEAPGPFTSSTATDPSPQSPVRRVLFSLDIPPTYDAPGPFTSSTATDPSPQSPVEHFSSQESPGIKLTDTTDQIPLSFDGDDHLQPGDVYIPPGAAAFLPTSCNINDLLSQSPVGLSASWPSVINVEDVEDQVKAVGSTQIQNAAGKRRKKDGIYACPFRKLRNANNCNATFTARHNLRYHIFAHLGLKPYECGKCKYAASSPATTKRHQLSCKSTSHSTEDNAIQ